MRILAIGEAMAELAPAETPAAFNLGFAGDTFNTAWYLAQRSEGLEVSYFTTLGDDGLSGDLLDFMAESGIETRQILRQEGKTIGLYLITLDQGERSFSYWRGQSAARGLADDAERLDRAMAEADLIFFSGITLAILPPSGRVKLMAALKTARAAGKTIAFDPNLRPRLWADGAEMVEAIMQAAQVCDIALPSFEDEAEWFADVDPEATIARYVEAGSRTVVVKNGGAPVLYQDWDGRGEVAVPTISNIVDTTAAGDSFNAGVIAGIAEGQPLAISIAQAVALSGKVVCGRGALVRV